MELFRTSTKEKCILSLPVVRDINGFTLLVVACYIVFFVCFCVAAYCIQYSMLSVLIYGKLNVRNYIFIS